MTQDVYKTLGTSIIYIPISPPNEMSLQSISNRMSICVSVCLCKLKYLSNHCPIWFSFTVKLLVELFWGWKISPENPNPAPFLVAKLLYNLKCPSVCMYVCLSETFWGKRDFLSSYKR